MRGRRGVPGGLRQHDRPSHTIGQQRAQRQLAGAALMDLNTTYVPQMAQNLSAPLNISTSSANRMLTDQVTTIKQFIDDAATGTPSAFYPDVRAAYAKSTAMGGSIAEAAVWK